MKLLSILLLILSIQFDNLAQNRIYADKVDVTSAMGNVGILYINPTIPTGNTISNTSAETFFTTTYTIPANTLKVGDVLVIKLKGFYSTSGVLATALRGKVYLNNNLINDTGSVSTILGTTNGGWFGEASYSILAIGTSGNFDGQAYVQFQSGLLGALSTILPGFTPYTLDTTIDQTIRVSATWGGQNVSNSITLRQMLVYKHRLP